VRHRHLHPRVVEDIVELADEGDGVLQRGVGNEKQRDREADRDPNDVLFQGCFGTARASGKIPS
jgi:hypothetical protein